MIKTGVDFHIADSEWQRVYDAAEAAEQKNVRRFGDRDV